MNRRTKRAIKKWQKVDEDYMAGMPVKDIAKKHGYKHPSSIYRVLKRLKEVKKD